MFSDALIGGLLGAVAGVLLGVPAAVFIVWFYLRHPVGKAVTSGVARMLGTAKVIEQEQPKSSILPPPTRRL